MNGLKKFFGKNDIEVFESGRKSAEQARQKEKTRKPKTSKWKKYLAVGASLAILGFATPLGAEKEGLANDFQGNPLKANTIEMTSDIASGNSSALLAMNNVSEKSDQSVQQDVQENNAKMLNEVIGNEIFDKFYQSFLKEKNKYYEGQIKLWEEKKKKAEKIPAHKRKAEEKLRDLREESSPENIKASFIRLTKRELKKTTSKKETTTPEYITSLNSLTGSEAEEKEIYAKIFNMMSIENNAEIGSSAKETSEKIYKSVWLSKMVAPYFKLPAAKKMLDEIEAAGFKIKIQPPELLKDKNGSPIKGSDGSYMYEAFSAKTRYTPEEKTIIISTPEDFKYIEKASSKDYSNNSLIDNNYLHGRMRAFGHELRHAWQCANGIEPVNYNDNFQDQIMKRRMREADASAVEAALMWGFKDKPLNWDKPYEYMANDGVKKDIAETFQKFASNDGINEQAYAEAFKKWYEKPSRVSPYNLQIINGYIRTEKPSSFNPEDWMKKLTIPGTKTKEEIKYVENNVPNRNWFKTPETFSLPAEMKVKYKDGKTVSEPTPTILRNREVPQEDIDMIFFTRESNQPQTSFIQRRNDASKKIAAYNNKPNINAIVQRKRLISHRRT